MDKKVLKEVLASLVVGQEVGFTFRGEKAAQSGNYRVTESRIGRGKMGSRLATLESLTDSSVTVSVNTKNNDEVLNATVAGTSPRNARQQTDSRRSLKPSQRAIK